MRFSCLQLRLVRSNRCLESCGNKEQSQVLSCRARIQLVPIVQLPWLSFPGDNSLFLCCTMSGTGKTRSANKIGAGSFLGPSGLSISSCKQGVIPWSQNLRKKVKAAMLLQTTPLIYGGVQCEQLRQRKNVVNFRLIRNSVASRTLHCLITCKVKLY